ncbi:hypothetical protein [Ornithinimicrobium sp. INDO-MA30-4]|uniref:hypothetical protein n=1 Tax=Ornithinimicrobium sp. INDO-MA30-4 TaxID=2908651 RepID=UPI001F38A674|nr:hypothetical protein [Ornithinimicrobium sp. INDO-MA30-4]UJH71189.1 hypothetical protein L0A91_04990 [Ornithinimicrobium sp. INDO-MA30-4]
MTSTQRALRTWLILSLSVGFAAAGHGLAGAHHDISWSSIIVAIVALAAPAWYAVGHPLRFGTGVLSVLGLQVASHIVFALVPLMAAGASLGGSHHELALSGPSASPSLGTSLLASASPGMVATHVVAALCVVALWSAADAAAVALDRWLSHVLAQPITVASVDAVVISPASTLRSQEVCRWAPARGPPVLVS